jgi:Oxysterol-binding protein
LGLDNFLILSGNIFLNNEQLLIPGHLSLIARTMELTGSWLQVQGYVEDVTGNRVASLRGEWNNTLYYEILKPMNSEKVRGKGESLLWKKNEPPADPTRYNLSSFAIALNELTPELQV